MKTTEELVQDILGDVNIKIPELIQTLNKNISGKNSEIKDILDIALNLKSTMESFSKSVDQIKNLSEYIEISKETNLRLEEISKQIEDSLSIIVGLNDKINKTKENLGKKSTQAKLQEAVGDRTKSASSKGIDLKTISFIIFGTSIVSSLSILVVFKLFIN